MRLATLRIADWTSAVRVEAETAVRIEGFADVGELLREPAWRTIASSAESEPIELSALDASAWAPVVPAPSKIICVGLNYRSHILEMGREIPGYPTLFAKFPEALIGAFDPIEVPESAASAVDWEGELAVIIGAKARNVHEDDASAHIAGFAVLNDLTMRDFQYRTPQWLQGKTFENTTPVGPILVTPDEFDAESAILRTSVDGEVVQEIPVGDLVFSPAALIAYISSILTLNPGDLIATGTPGGVGHARSPQRYLNHGAVLETTIDGIGSLKNLVVVGG